MTARYVIAAVALFAAGALLTPHAATAAPTVSTATPKALSLTLRDVQRVYGSAFRSQGAIASGASHKASCGANHTGGYQTVFRNPRNAGKTGAVSIVISIVWAFPNSRSAACALLDLKALGTHVAGMKSHRSSLSGVGDRAYLITTSQGGSYNVFVDFARGTHVAMVEVNATGRLPAQSGVIALAKVIDGRLQAAG
jgi:hypothetical protein